MEQNGGNVLLTILLLLAATVTVAAFVRYELNEDYYVSQIVPCLPGETNCFPDDPEYPISDYGYKYIEVPAYEIPPCDNDAVVCEELSCQIGDGNCREIMDE